MSDIESFLASVSIFRELTPEQLHEIAPLFREEHHAAGTLILRQGGQSAAVYFLKSGRLAVRVLRPEGRETVAYLQPPAVFGELSFITGRTCSADVEVVVDADVVLLPRDAVPKLPKQREGILRGMMTVLAERLHDTVTRGTRAAESPVVLLRAHPHWEAPYSFAVELGRALAKQTGQETLVVHLDGANQTDLRLLAERAFVCDLPLRSDSNMRGQLAARLTEWKQRFNNVVLNPVGSQANALHEQAKNFADYFGDLVGAGDSAPEESAAKRFVVESAASPTMRFLSGNRQLVWQAAESETAYHNGDAAPSRFVRTVDSIARFIADLQVGLALGGGAAWGWAHIGVINVLEENGIPIDMISGCSMGSVIGTLRSSGRSVPELREIAAYWNKRTKRFVEWRVWKMHLLQESRVRKAFESYFAERQVNQTETPFWANAVDVKTGKEFTIQDGSLVDAVRASIALPGLLPPIAREGKLLVDAGVIDPVPVNLIRRMGCRFAIAVNAMAPLEAQEVSTRYPLNIFDVMFRCMRIMGHEIGQARSEAAADIMMVPPYGDIPMLAFDRSAEIIECGRRVTEQNMPAIQAAYDRLRLRPAAQANFAEQRI